MWLRVSAAVLGAVGLCLVDTGMHGSTKTRGHASVLASIQYMGNPRHTKLGCWPEPTPVRTDMRGKKVVVAGGSKGIGRAAAITLMKLGADVHVLSRSGLEHDPRSNYSGSGSVTNHIVDLSSIQNINEFVDNFQSKHAYVDVLINNAMVMPHNARQSPDGYELAVSTGLVGWRLLTRKLEPLLARAAQQHGEARVVNVVSAGMHLVGLDPAELEELATASGRWGPSTWYDGIRAYCLVHRARVSLSAHWAAAWKARGLNISSSTVHPGWVDTPGLRGAKPMRGFYSLAQSVLRSEEQGADTIVWLSASADASAQVQTGKYFWDRAARWEDLLGAPTKPSTTNVNKVAQWLDNLQ